MIIAIDGPSGAGKSTVAEAIAKRFHFQLIDTGAIYRTLTYLALRDAVVLSDGDAVAAFARRLNFRFAWVDGRNVLYCNDAPMGDEIRTQEVSTLTSQVASLPMVRQALLGIQRCLGRGYSSVLEGRDIGTVVFPDADVKIFLAASADERARRRVAQAKGRGESLSFQEVKLQIEARDARDSGRDVAPLRCPPDALRVDSTTMSLEEVVEVVAEEVLKVM